MDNFAPKVFASYIDFFDPASPVTLMQLLQDFEDIPVRYTVNLDYSRPERSVILAEAYNRNTLTWNELWKLRPEAYGFDRSPNIDHQVEFNQELVDDLFSFVSEIL